MPVALTGKRDSVSWRDDCRLPGTTVGAFTDQSENELGSNE